MRRPNPYVPSVTRLSPEELAEIAAEFQPLKPCPKCGGWTVRVRPAQGRHWARLDCSTCGCIRRYLPTPEGYVQGRVIWQ